MHGRKADKARACRRWIFSGLLPGLVLVCLGLMWPVAVQAQEQELARSQDGQVTALLTTTDKQVQVGLPFRVQLEVEHPADMVVIFPDTGLDYAPYELYARQPMATRTEDGISTDLVLYQLYSWSIDSLQYISLPVGYIAGGDTNTFFSNTEELLFIPKIPTLTDSTEFLYLQDLAKVAEPVNWTVTGILLVVLVLLLGLGTAFLYGPIRKYLLRRRIDREWRRYQQQLLALEGQRDNQEAFLLGLARVWKGYLDRNWQRGLGSLSSKELKTALDQISTLDEADREVLYELNRSADRVTYAGGSPLPSSQLERFFTEARRIMAGEYRRRKEAAEV